MMHGQRLPSCKLAVLKYTPLQRKHNAWFRGSGAHKMGPAAPLGRGLTPLTISGTHRATGPILGTIS